MSESDQNNSVFSLQNLAFDHWGVLAIIILVACLLGGALGLLAGKKLGGSPPKMSDSGITAPQALPEKVDNSAGDSVIRSIFARISACIRTADKQIPVTLYIADTPELRQRGLQGVPGLPENHGMLFMYDQLQPADSQFWMYQTPMNLDISYLDSRGQIQSIQQLQSCSLNANSCPKYKAGIPFKAAAEFPHGFYRSKGVTVGDRISLDAFASCSRS